ncbi:MAG: arsenite methyltransferase [Gemmatimonadota bacterium]|nr:MAG: arsenite methyltransferase [Gemmatimonadota bacterium]
MADAQQLKEIVKERYGRIARQSVENSCCSCSTCCPSDGANQSTFSDSYDHLKGYIPGADLGLGCGLPTEFAGIKRGDTVVDLGSGAGNDAFITRSIVGDEGRVIGIDMTRDMVDKARVISEQMGYNNIEFRTGDIENLPVEGNSVDVVISNCVINLVPDKKKAFSEMHRILRPGAHFCISDVVLKGELPEKLRKSAEMYAGCIAGSLQQDAYLRTIQEAGFSDVEIKTSKEIHLPDTILREYLTDKEMAEFRERGVGIFSITVVGYKT